ncbi:hypothetical protein P3T18_000019 [Paraburkholderia sp. GAS199]
MSVNMIVWLSLGVGIDEKQVDLIIRIPTFFSQVH